LAVDSLALVASAATALLASLTIPLMSVPSVPVFVHKIPLPGIIDAGAGSKTDPVGTDLNIAVPQLLG
jgi:hypothetical protein